MTKNKLKFSNVEGFRENLTKFYFMAGGYFGGYESISVEKTDKKIIYIYRHDYKRISIKYSISKKKWNEFTEKIFNESIYKWKKKYYNNDILDGEQWELKMEFNDLILFESFGSNEYPNNWDTFQEIIYEYFPQMR